MELALTPPARPDLSAPPSALAVVSDRDDLVVWERRRLR
jgi:hypothetical protein